MKILVTVGTTSFDSMIEAADKCAAKLDDHQFTFQIADGRYIPQYGDYFNFSDSISDYYSQSDGIITHAGAGSTYKLLELRKKIIVVPNLDRVDKHQSDIANFLEENNYALVVWKLSNLQEILNSIDDFQPTIFEKQHFLKLKKSHHIYYLRKLTF